MRARRYGRVLRNSVFWTISGCYTCKLTGAVDAFTKPVHDQFNQNSVLGRIDDHQASPLLRGFWQLTVAGGGRIILLGVAVTCGFSMIHRVTP